MNIKSIIGMFAAILMALTAFVPSAAAALPSIDSADMAITPYAGDGVSIDYDEGAFSLRVTDFYGMFKVDQAKTLSLTASFEEGWTYNSDFSNFFASHSENVTETSNADGSITFVYDAHKGDIFTKDELYTIGVYATPETLPRLDIQAAVPFSQITKEEYVEATFTITLGTKQFSSGNYEGAGSIKGRGNTSWGQPKKPYTIKLNSKASLLDIPKTKKYAIIPSYSDDSLLRNYMTYKSAVGYEGIDYTPRCEFVEAYLNGSYNGIYLLVERVDIESNKIDIDEATADELTGGYLIEKDIDGKIDYDADQWFNCPYWANQSHDYFVLKTPEPSDDELRAQMLAYLESYMQSLHNAVMDTSSNAYEQYVDVDSWADFMILQEIAKNIDGNLKTSCYMVKMAQDDHLYMTAPWDFDLAYGSPYVSWNNADWNHNDYYDCPDAQSYSSFMTINSSCPWFDTLYDDHEEFRELLIERYRGYRETVVPDMYRYLHSGAAYLASAIGRDEAKWGVRFEEGYNELNSWLAGRLDWLDSEWLDSIAIDLDYALNVEGGHLTFTTSENYPFRGVIKDGRIAGVSGNTGFDSTESVLTLVLDMQAGETLSFDYKVSSEQNYDMFLFGVNSTTRVSESGEVDWTSYTYTAPSSGSYTFTWKLRKDYSYSTGSDCVWVDNVCWSGDNLGLLGDVDINGTVDSIDALLTLRYAMGLVDSLPAEYNADVNGDGVIDSVDALMILRMSFS